MILIFSGLNIDGSKRCQVLIKTQCLCLGFSALDTFRRTRQVVAKLLFWNFGSMPLLLY